MAAPWTWTQLPSETTIGTITMCNPVGGGMTMPPMKPAAATTPAEKSSTGTDVAGASGSGTGPATKAGGNTAVAGAAGQASTGAATLGGGPALSAVLDQLRAAVAALTSLIGTMGGGALGGGPIQSPGQMPTQMAPGKFPGQSSGGGGDNPAFLLANDIKVELAKPHDAADTATLKKLELAAADITVQSNRTGSFDPTKLMIVGLQLDAVKLPAADPRRAALLKLVPAAEAAAAEAAKTGSFNPVVMMDLGLQADIAKLPAGDARIADLTKLRTEVAAQKQTNGGFDAVALQRLSDLRSAILR
ncbi:MAG: hypothetical protein JWM86_895 [Thermoleophilia bacterium]|nr:hypothetical protein [Thermoleophilia bacterium]